MLPAELKNRAHPSQRGFVLITMMLSLVVLLGFLGLAVDVGYLQLVKTRMQTAADAAALGGVQDLRMNGSSGVVTAAKADAATNGFTDGQKGVTVTVNRPPKSGNYMTDNTAVEVIISQSAPTFFMQAMGLSSMTVQARSVARQGAGTTCVYVLDPTANKALNKTGSGSLSSPCGIWVNSSDTQALNQTGSGSINTTPASTSIVGGYKLVGSGSITPTPVTGVTRPAIVDPFATRAVPSLPGSCDHTRYKIPGDPTTLDPGVYCQGISISGSTAVTFHPGVYIINGGNSSGNGLDFAGSGGGTGTGVTFYLTADASHTYGGIQVTGSGNYTFSAPTSGNYEALLFIGDATRSSSHGSSIVGSTNMILNGVIYLPKEDLQFAGSCTGTNYQVLVANTLTINGSTQLHNNYSGLSSGSPVRSGGVVSE